MCTISDVGLHYKLTSDIKYKDAGIDISPKGKWCPLYQRDKYKSNETKYIDMQRFVYDKELRW